MSDAATNIERQFAKRSDKPSAGLRDVKLYWFPRVIENSVGERELTEFVKEMPWGTKARNQVTAEAVNHYNSTCAWVDEAGTPTRVKPRPLTDAEAKVYWAAKKRVAEAHGKAKEAARIRNAPRAVLITQADGTAQVVKNKE